MLSLIDQYRVFKLNSFRQNQLESVNAALAGKDCFVLMPTGGGKSLCYQLPATISLGATTGITVVISPLISLIQDQIQHLQAKDIPCAWLSGTMDPQMRKWVFQELKRPQPVLKLIYMTPEMVNKSGQVQKALFDLYTRKQLARFVIDEAHCLSQWGHDFRPDYKDLGNLRNTFVQTPVMALTATANEKVKMDIKVNLRMNQCLEFAMSFNRPNLIYEIRPKIKNFQTEMVELIRKNWLGQSGIIYCTSKRACEELSETLRTKHGLACHYYHAGMEKEDRVKIQQSWQHNQIQIIVATVAFGMGIDKPDVRFVIHNSLPHSLEGYYQETGRAGRDGKPSYCILYYSYSDKKTIEFLIDRGEGPREQKERQKENLRQMILFCENNTDCRRQQVLAYFGETFDPALCNRTCDVCKIGRSGAVKTDLTDMARKAIRLIESLENQTVTLSYCVDVFRGSKIQKIVQNGHDMIELHGAGKSLTKSDTERLFRGLVLQKVLKEVCQENSSGFVSSYVRLGSAARRSLMAPDFKFEIQLNDNPVAEIGGKRKTVIETVYEDAPVDDHGYSFQDDDISDYYDGDDIDDFAMDEFDEPNPSRVQVEDDPNMTQMPAVNPPPIKLKYDRASLPENQRLKLYESLRQERNRIAGGRGVAPIGVFTDSILLSVSKVLPTSVEELVKLCLADATKASLYGQYMIDIVAKFTSGPVVPQRTTVAPQSVLGDAGRNKSLYFAGATKQPAAGSGIRMAPMRSFK
jgi:RecQ family ATP-dependent DNA helicase